MPAEEDNESCGNLPILSDNFCLVVNNDSKLCLIDFGWATFDKPHKDKDYNLTPSKIKNAKTCLDVFAE